MKPVSTSVWIGELTLDKLQHEMHVSENELAYLQQLVNLRSKKRQIQSPKDAGYARPSVIIDNFLYHGELKHAENKYLLNGLNIGHIINVSDCPLQQDILDHFNVLWINLDDAFGVDISQYFETTNEFLNICKKKDEKVLVHCQMGISRSSTIVLAYLLKYHYDSLANAYDYLVERRRFAAPNHSFFLQLIRYERKLYEKPDVNKPPTIDKK
ncbi:unnamed protein product [Rotaria magnacalcarata]|nr:unnamed protein product [Rotaria magnacalcarata]CAF4187815.1 unnamed protein product [Rotaria magnacalcarata]CAF4201363.1 unnamed protein product [Rotaria magnacalcarata]